MKLTKEEIKFINNYLIKNDVKFWDVRLELLDHIISAVEAKIADDGISFNEALLDVHRGFGNQLIEAPTITDKMWVKGLYQSNIGFKKFTRNKQLELGKKNRRRYGQIFKKMISSSWFLLEYIIYILIVTACYYYNPKTAYIIALLALVIPELFKLKYVFNKGIMYSLYANMMGLFGSMFLCLQGALISFYKAEFTNNGILDYRYIICLYIIMYPFFRANLNLYKEVIATVNARYKLFVS